MTKGKREARQRGPKAPTAATGSAPPSFIEPCLATLRSKPPDGVQYVHEIKLDGYRTQAHKRDGKQVIYTRRGYDWTKRFTNIAEAISRIRAATVVLDGEVIVPDRRGASDYHALQLDLARGRSDRFVYFVFDLLFLNGTDLRPQPLLERKRLLTELLSPRPSGVLRISEHLAMSGEEVFARVCEMELEGIVSKRLDAPYRSGRSDLWFKTKCSKSDTYPIIAFVEKLGAHPRRIASLYVGRYEGGRLLYAGKLRSGYTDRTAREVRELLDPLIRRTSPLTIPISKPKATWIEPVRSAEVEFSSITADGILREAVFKGIREPADLERAPTHAPRRASTGVPRQNILQLLPDAVVPSKEELVAYWQTTGTRALKYLGNRPLKLVRHSRGTTFYHKGPFPPVPTSVHQLKVAKREGGEGTRLWIDDIEGFLGLVEIGAIELHPWNATVDHIELADVLVFDLDPGPGIDYEFVTESALALRELLKGEGLQSWPKLTGGKGIHVMAPLRKPLEHDEARRYSRQMCERLARRQPSRYTLSARPADRQGRVFIDYLRNGRGTTAVGTYSPRAREGFPIAAPVSWRDIERGLSPQAFTMRGPRRERR